MDEVKTWADFAALSEEDRSALSSEDLEALRTSVADNEAKLAKDREAEVAKLKSDYESQKIRAEKAEGKKDPKPELKPDVKDKLSDKDVLYLAKADIHEDDVEEVLEYSRKHEVGVKEAHAYLKPILDRKGEERKTAQATQIKSPRGTTKVSDEEVLARASRGELPDSDEGIERLAEASINARRNRK